MKKIARSIIVSLLGRQVRRLQRDHTFKVVGVVGSIGKTSTKSAIATVLAEKHRVRFQSGNYNDLVTVPLIFFNESLPSLFNPFAWLKLLYRNHQQLRKPYPYDVVVVELGTDYPGNISKFAAYLHCDVTVVTAITPEHMEFFKDLEDVANEELSVAAFSDSLVVNIDLCPARYLNVAAPIQTFGTQPAEYEIKKIKMSDMTASFLVHHEGKQILDASMEAVAKSEVYSATAATVVADLMGIPMSSIKKGIAAIRPVSGRMQRLRGIRNSLILDETYNASPDAVMAALDTLYELEAPQKIAILGNMNELGEMSAEAHRQVGEYCEPAQLDLVVTIGPEANEFLAPAAAAKGCKVETFTDPYSAGNFVKEYVKPRAVILAKGSQNNVYAEEAVKPLLASPKDIERLVRQSAAWLSKKERNFFS